MSENRTRTSLTIHPAPFKSSFLAIPPSPFSPRTPLALKPSAISPGPVQHTEVYLGVISDAPPSPLSWVWQCHECHRSYQLGVTRRCLEDGHHFCSGTTTVKSWRQPVNPRRVKRHRACASEFDYQGWKIWGRWQRSGSRQPLICTGSAVSNTGLRGRLAQQDGIAAEVKKDCWNKCDYPSECRWGKKFGIHTPIQQGFPTLEVSSMPLLTSPTDIEEGVLKSENCKEVCVTKEERKDFWGALVASAKRRKSSMPGSPLASVREETELEHTNKRVTVQVDRGGDTVMKTVDPAVFSHSPEPPSPIVSVPSVPSTGLAAVDMLKDFMKRKTTGKVRGLSFGPDIEGSTP